MSGLGGEDIGTPQYKKVKKEKDPILSTLLIIILCMLGLSALLLFIWHAQIAMEFARVGKKFADDIPEGWPKSAYEESRTNERVGESPVPAGE